MAKVLISSIGIGSKVSDREYRIANYKFENSDKLYKTSFVSAALAEYLKVDKIIFIGTARSMWEEIYRYFTEKLGDKIDDDYWQRLVIYLATLDIIKIL